MNYITHELDNYNTTPQIFNQRFSKDVGTFGLSTLDYFSEYRNNPLYIVQNNSENTKQPQEFFEEFSQKYFDFESKRFMVEKVSQLCTNNLNQCQYYYRALTNFQDYLSSTNIESPATIENYNRTQQYLKALEIIMYNSYEKLYSIKIFNDNSTPNIIEMISYTDIFKTLFFDDRKLQNTFVLYSDQRKNQAIVKFQQSISELKKYESKNSDSALKLRIIKYEHILKLMKINFRNTYTTI